MNDMSNVFYRPIVWLGHVPQLTTEKIPARLLHCWRVRLREQTNGHFLVDDRQVLTDQARQAAVALASGLTRQSG